VQELALPPITPLNVPYVAVAPWVTVTDVGAATLMDCGMESVNSELATDPEDPVAATV
jgi:hypothetical protein